MYLGCESAFIILVSGGFHVVFTLSNAPLISICASCDASQLACKSSCAPPWLAFLRQDISKFLHDSKGPFNTMPHGSGVPIFPGWATPIMNKAWRDRTMRSNGAKFGYQLQMKSTANKYSLIAHHFGQPLRWVSFKAEGKKIVFALRFNARTLFAKATCLCYANSSAINSDSI